MIEPGSSSALDPSVVAIPTTPPPSRRRRSNRRRTNREADDLTFPEPVLAVRAWPDPVLDQLGHDPRSAYVERFWLAVLGPSCLLFVRRLVHNLDQHPEGFNAVSTEWAGEMGLGLKGGRHGPYWRAIERAHRFKAVQRHGATLMVRRRLPPLTKRQVERLPPALGAAHRDWQRQQLERPKRPTIATWSPRREAATRPGA